MSEQRVSGSLLGRQIGVVVAAIRDERRTVIVTDEGRDAVVMLHPDEYAALVRDRAAWNGSDR